VTFTWRHFDCGLERKPASHGCHVRRAWGFVNFSGCLVAPASSLGCAVNALLVTLIAVSRFKFDVLWMAASFVDV